MNNRLTDDGHVVVDIQEFTGEVVVVVVVVVVVGRGRKQGRDGDFNITTADDDFSKPPPVAAALP